MTDYFEVLGLPVSSSVDLSLLEQRYRSLQQQWHPDRRAGGSAAEQAAALQQTSLINDAYETLKSPLKRAAHLLALQGMDVSGHSQSQLEPGFLLEQMELRDQLETRAREQDLEGTEALRRDAAKRFESLWLAFTSQLEKGAVEQAQRAYYELQFMQRFIEEARAVEDRLLDY